MKTKPHPGEIIEVLSQIRQPQPVVVADEKGEPSGSFMFATYQHLPCGCGVIGNGTSTHPLTVSQCEFHESIREVLLIAEDALKWYDNNQNRAVAQGALNEINGVLAKWGKLS